MADVPPPNPFRSFSASCPWLIPWFLPGTVAGFIIARCVMLSGKRLLWADELLTWYPVSAPFGTMLASTTDTINASPPLYFVGTWVWAHLFGNSALSLRLPSALALAAAILMMFSVLRRVYGVLASTLAVALALTLCDPALLFHATEARFHTLIVAEVALAILLYQRMMAWQGRVPFGLLAANAGIHACLVMTHYFGPLYSGTVLIAILLTSAVLRFNPTRSVASLVVGWMVFLLWIPTFQRHLGMGKPTFWIDVPHPAHLRIYLGHYFTDAFWVIAVALLAIAIAGLVFTLVTGGGLRNVRSKVFIIRRPELPLLMLIPGFSSVPLMTYYISTRPGSVSVFLDRYMHSGALGWAILCAFFIHRIFVTGTLGQCHRLRLALTVIRVAGVAVAICWGGWGLLQPISVASGITYEDILVGSYYDDKIVVEHPHEYLTQNFYSSRPERYLFVVDKEVGRKEGGGGPVNHQIMAGLKRNFPEHFKGVVSNEDFLSDPEMARFWVKRSDGIRWWQLRIENNPAFLSEASEGGLIHVTRADQAQ